MNIKELKKEAQEALENGDLAKAKELLAQIKSVKETEQEQKAIEAELAELTEEPVEEEPAEEVVEEEVAEPETEEPAETEEVEVEELEEDKEGEERRMKEIQDLTSKVQDFEAYIRTQGTETRGLDTTNGSVLVPVDVTTSVLELKDGQVDLSKYVTKEAVGTGQGKFPVAKRAQAILATKAELAEIAEIDEPLFLEVDYKVETRIGQIAFSNEIIEDSEINVVAYAKRSMERMVTNTNNANIMTVLNDFAKVNATNADELKRVVNVDLDPELDLKIVLNQDAYQVIDTMKDADGRYLLQDSIASASGKMLFGKEVIVVSNKVAKTPKDTAGFIFVGDLKEAVFMAQRNEISAEWEKFDRYSKGLAVGIRSDYKKIDADAGKLVNFTQA
ncbi:phage major capsid protein [Enterococcus casseliflavus]|uniref:phage major capsid protein n=1 Tax=Enterococcus casseliflavus TaxID=37734 RepID=UPI00143312F5|nr:phage major capsid protein [Enterococcus casseliflavus]NKD37890.1 phage major capsid protein [Enterococcus casseliflavus]